MLNNQRVYDMDEMVEYILDESDGSKSALAVAQLSK